MTGSTPAGDLVEVGLATAAASPRVEGCAVLVEETSTVNLRWALSGLTTNGVASARSVTAVVAVAVAGGTAVGVLRRQGIDAEGVKILMGDAEELASRSTPAEDANPWIGGTADAPGWSDPGGRTGPGTLAPVAAGLGEVFGRAAAAGRECFGFAEHDVSTVWLGTGAGLRYRFEQPAGTVELTGKAAARTRSAWVGRATRDFADVDVLALDDEVATRLRWQERTVEVPPGRYDTVLPPSAVADLLVYLWWSSDARSAAEGRSVFSVPGAEGRTRLGEVLTGQPLTLVSDPHRPGLECADRVVTGSSSPFASVFDNGLPVGPATWLDRGRVAALPSTRHTAALTGLPVVPAADNLVMTADGATGSTDDLVRATDRGLLLTCLWYIREVDPRTLLLTGLTRDGVYLVEGGEVVGAASNFRFNESPVDVLARVRAAGATTPTLAREWGEYAARTAMPPLLVEGFNMSTASEAS